MRYTIGVGLRACACAGALFVAVAHAAESPSVSVGATREQVLSRYGEPRSVMVAGTREILWFARERLVLRDGIVVEVERLATEPARPARPAPVPSAEVAPAPEIASAVVSSPSTDGAVPGAAEPAVSADAAERPAVEPPPPPEPVLAIRSVRLPTAGYVRPEPKQRLAEISEPVGAEQAATPGQPASPEASVHADSATASPAIQAAAMDVPSSADRVASGTVEATDDAGQGSGLPELATKPAEVDPNLKLPEMSPLQEAAAPQPTAQETVPAAAPPKRQEQAWSGSKLRTYVIVSIVILAGGGFLFWRIRQRQLEMTATALSHTPFSVPVRGSREAQFTQELIEKLEWKRFEELVASYYGKTGVVAFRTKTGPGSPVHIKISWKGEPRPFACVQCIAHPTGLIDVKPVQELFDAISAEDIRRGYLVSTGKFSVAARDFAEEKHLTLMSGDVLVEKLNALPDPARAELMGETTAGDLTTPSCPKCESKMERSPVDATVWRCAAHPDVTFPVRE